MQFIAQLRFALVFSYLSIECALRVLQLFSMCV